VTNQLTLGTTTISSTAPSASRVYTIPDAGAAANFVLDTAGALTITNVASIGNVLTKTGSTTASWQTPGSGGAVTSVGLSLPGSLYFISGSPVTSTGTLTGTLLTQSANLIWAGPASGSAATPTFRSLNLADLPQLTNGQLYVGSTSASVVAATLTGTANQVIVTNGAGSITLSTPQNIGTSSSPTFASETLTAVTNQLTLGTTTISSTAPSASRVYTIPDAGAAANFVLDTADALTITNVASIGDVLTKTGSTTASWQTPGAGGSVTSVGLSLPGSLYSISGSPVTSTGTLTGTLLTQSANLIWAGPASGSAATPTFRSLGLADLLQLTNGQLYVGSTSASVVAATLTGTANQVNVANGAGSITLSTPQNIGTSSTPSFASMSLNAPYIQLVLGTTNTITISTPTISFTSRVYTIPDAGAAANFVLDTGGPLTITNAAFPGSALIATGTGTASWQSLPTFNVVMDNLATPTYPTAPQTEGIWYGSNAKAGLSTLSTIVIGNVGCTAGNNSIAIGTPGATANSNASVAVGANAHANGACVAVGSDTSATGENDSTVFGYGSTTSGISATAIGVGGISQAHVSTAIGRSCSCNSQGSFAAGLSAQSTSVPSTISIGATSTSSADYAIAIGYNSNTYDVYSIAHGYGVGASGSNSIVLGKLAASLGTESIAIGAGATTSGANQIAIGAGATSGLVSNSSSPLSIVVGSVSNNPILTISGSVSSNAQLYVMVNGVRYKILMSWYP
jgi:trimeric autotransporter adhesin